MVGTAIHHMGLRLVMLVATSVLLASVAHAGIEIVHRRDGMPNVFARLNSGKPTVIAYLGGSITAGAGASSADKTSWRALTTAWFRAQYPKAQITEVNAAIGGTGSDLGVFRLQRDVLDKRPDLVFVEFAVNDDGHGEIVGPSMEGIVRKIIAANPKTDICFVYTIHAGMLPDLKSGKLPATMQTHESVAERYGIPSVNVGAAAFIEEVNSGRMAWEEFTKDGCHPTDAGYSLYTRTLTSFLASEAAGKSRPRAHRMATLLYKDSLHGARLVEVKPDPASPQWLPEAQPPPGVPAIGLSSDTPGATIAIPFKGDTIGIYFTLGPDTGNLDYKIDNGEYQTLAPFDAWSQYYRIAYGILAARLENTDHTLTLRIRPDRDPGSKGTRTRLHYLMVNGK